ncbi:MULTISPECIES: hypothetical protein [unclassified Bradyrhizobium]|uniref:hypothetical protein n=1 Tax=Bradyrhizobium sp. USDA 4541 TaxID=2817704 RepID=UPI0020A3A37C|nr:hypothetical protein [Bradyrhizobium sp. USDA 4541]MCP1850061.1 hypothetical protein [Bradyrhizobium sp. USDA 4541]
MKLQHQLQIGLLPLWLGVGIATPDLYSIEMSFISKQAKALAMVANSSSTASNKLQLQRSDHENVLRALDFALSRSATLGISDAAHNSDTTR